MDPVGPGEAGIDGILETPVELGICTAPEALSSPPAGLAFFEANVQALLVPGQDEAAFAANLAVARASVVPVRAANCLLPGALKAAG